MKEPRQNRRQPARPRAAAASSDVRAALDAFRLIVQALRAGARGGAREPGLSTAQLFALQQIADHPRASVNELAALTYTHQSSVSVVVQRLVDRGLVARITSREDRRRHCLVLTAEGRRVLRRAPSAVQERLIAAIAALPPADRRVLARSLALVARAVAPDGARPRPPMFFEEDHGARTSSSRPRSPRS